MEGIPSVPPNRSSPIHLPQAKPLDRLQRFFNRMQEDDSYIDKPSSIKELRSIVRLVSQLDIVDKDKECALNRVKDLFHTHIRQLVPVSCDALVSEQAAEAIALQHTLENLEFLPVQILSTNAEGSLKDALLSQPNLRLNVRIGTLELSLQSRECHKGEPILDAGSYGRVLFGVDPITQREIAVKIALPALKEESLRAEGTKLLLMQYAKYVVGAQAVGLQDGMLFAVMDHIEGITLSATLHQTKLDLPEAIFYAVDIAKAIQELHETGIIHRDVKPGNILVKKDTNQCYLCDLGLSIFYDEKKNNLVGTLKYSAPEVLSRSHDILKVMEQNRIIIRREVFQHHTTALDVYGFGIVLHRMLTGEILADPSTMENAIIRLTQNITVDKKHYEDLLSTLDNSQNLPEEARAFILSINEKIVTLVEACLRWNPIERISIQDALSKLEEIQEMLESEVE